MIMWKVQRNYYLTNPDMHFKISLGLWIVSWILQFVGHGVFESTTKIIKNESQPF
jgi:uncharacterized membrane protein YGL010W